MGKRKKISPKDDHSPEEAQHVFVETSLSPPHGVNADTPAKEKTKRKRTEKPETPVVPTKTHVDQQLAEIYGNSDGTLPDMSHLDVRKRRRFLSAFFVLFLSCAVLGAVVLAGFFVWQPSSQFSEDNVVVSISGNEQAAIGEQVQYRIRYKNAQQLPLGKTVIQVHYPDGFVFESSSVSSTSDTHDEWAVGSLNKEDGGYIDITGRLYGDVDTEHSFRLFMNYVPGNFNSEFQKVAVATTKISQSPVEVTVDMPADISQGIETPVTVRIKRREGVMLPSGKLFLQIDPQGVFSKTKSEPKSDAYDQYQWSFEGLDTEKTIVVRGTFDPKGNEHPAIIARVSGEPKDAKQKRYVYAEKKTDVKIAASEVLTQLIVNGSASQLNSHPGDMLLTRVVVKNNGSSPLKNAKLRLRLDAPSANKQSIINWPKVVDQADGTIAGEQIDPHTRRGEIIWTSKELPELAEIAPGKEVAVDIQIPIKTAKETDLSDYTTHTVLMRAELQYPAGDTVQVLSSNAVEVVLQSDMKLAMEHVGSGVGAHDISWIITNTFHELKNIQVKMTFFGDVVPDEASIKAPPAGTATFDSQSKTLTWTIEKMPIVLDVLSFEYKVDVKKINPGQTQLTSKVQYEAIDAVTEEKIVGVVDAIGL